MYVSPSERSIKRGVLEVETVDAILAQNRAMAQQLSTMNKKLEKLEVSAIGAQSPTFHTCGIWVVLMKATSAVISHGMIHIQVPTIKGGRITPISVGEAIKAVTIALISRLFRGKSSINHSLRLHSSPSHLRPLILKLH
ncbi:hypothetical protein PIB30_112279 [Stylosanthes scabra]|uniref:Uncharacterized protein n=1 Tax=Stylosanthes scabra TaxID=79078 RepID=A0ABU6V2L5_9FABA|nr:hypothetical protein [Stylosanthes scabra]